MEGGLDLVPGATPIAKSPYRLASLEMKELSEQLQELQEEVKANMVTDVLSRKERVKPKRVRAMAMTIQYGVPLVGSEMDEAHASSLRYLSENGIELPWILSLNRQDNSKEWNSGDDQLRFRWMIYLLVLADAAESVKDVIGFEYCLASSSGWTNNLIGSEIVQETTDKVVSIKEKFKAVRDRQKSYAGNRQRKVSIEKYLADANLHVPLDEIKFDKTLRFVVEPVEIMDRGIKKLKFRKIALVKVRWNSKRGPKSQDEISSRREYCDIRDLISLWEYCLEAACASGEYRDDKKDVRKSG
ncbi:hypothetical protein Tco_0612155 [Tanacetum coccineum]